MKAIELNGEDSAGACCGGCGPRGGAGAGARHECVAAADALLAQAASFVALIDDASYARPCETASNGTIGKHIRHVLDHFAAALAVVDVAGDEGGGVIDYDHRGRDVPMETSRRVAATAIMVLRGQLGALGHAEMDAPVTVRVMVSQDGRTVDLTSTLGRELAFATHHALHHHAMMRFIAACFGVTTPEEFGKAPSTLHHERAGVFVDH